jgi:hypothetical protein
MIKEHRPDRFSARASRVCEPWFEIANREKDRRLKPLHQEG